MHESQRTAPGRLLDRRSFLFAVSAVALRAEQSSGKGQVFPSEARRYPDPSTEFPVLRLTSPTHSSYLTAYYNRGMAGRNTLFLSSDRTGRLELFRLDIRNGQSRQLTAAEHLDPATPALLPGDRAICYFDGPALIQLTLANLREREIYRVPEGYERGRGFSVSPDGTRGFFVEHASGKYRLRAVTLARGIATTIVESDQELSDPIPRPAHDSLLYRNGESCYMAGIDGKSQSKLALSPGEALSPFWSPDGSSLLYLNVSNERGQLNTIRELNIDTTTNKLIAKTTQYAGFGANGDATVFVGASGSKASPHVLILLRSARRELTLCEHLAHDPRIVSPVFAPNSQRILFMSDQHGKPAIYTMNVERFVEETES